MLAVGGLAAAGLPQQNHGLVLAGGQQAAVRRLGHGVDVRRRVLAAAPFEHVHHLPGEGGAGCQGWGRDRTLAGARLTFSEYMDGVLSGLMTTVLGPACV